MEELKVAVVPLGVSVPPAGVALQVTAPEQVPLELTVAVRLDVFPFGTVAGLATTVTLVTAHALPLPALPLPPALPPHPAAIAASPILQCHQRIRPPRTVALSYIGAVPGTMPYTDADDRAEVAVWILPIRW